MKLQLKRSNVLDGGKAKEPTPPYVEYGELCVNYNVNDPALFIKDSNDNIIRIAGKNSVGSGSNPSGPNNPNTGNNIGDVFFNTGDLILYYWDGNEWVPIASQKHAADIYVGTFAEVDVEIPVADRRNGLLLWETEEGNLFLWYIDADTAQWVVAVPGGGGGGGTGGGSNVTVLDVAPNNPEQGDLWYCTLDGRLYIYYQDINTSQWVDASPDNLAEGFWERDGTTLKPIVAGDDVDLGTGDLSAANGTFGDYDNGSGSRVWGSYGMYMRAPSTAGGSVLQMQSSNGGVNTQTMGVRADGTVEIGGTIPTNPNITLNANGNIDASSGHFDGSVVIEEGLTAAASGAGHFIVGADGGLRVQREGGGATIQVQAANVNGSEEGSIGFLNSANTQFYSFIGTGRTMAAGYSDYTLAFRTESTLGDFSFFTGGPSGSEKMRIVGSTGDVYIGGLPSSPNITLNADGTGHFAGQKIRWQSSGEFILDTINNDPNSEVLSVKTAFNSGNPVFQVLAGGNIKAKGAFQGNSLTFRLEPDDPVNYDAEGEYTGPTLDVKDRLLNLISRLDALEANEVIDDATDTSLLQLLANASARLDSIEARLTALEGGN